MRSLSIPVSEAEIRSLHAGDVVSLNGRLYTGRDKFHKFIAEGGKLPVDFSNGALYHCGPVCVGGEVEKWESGKECGGWRVVAAGPTTSVRENAYEPLFVEKSGVRLIIGKGGMDAVTHEAMRKHGCVYIQAIGGAGAFYASRVRRVAGVSLLDEFGAAEAVWHFDVEDFRGIVAMDTHGRSLFEDTRRASSSVLDNLFRT